MADQPTLALAGSDRPGWKRRVLWPALILLVAFVIWGVEKQRGQADVPELELFIRQSCAQAVAGDGAALTSHSSDPLIAESIITALRDSALLEPGAVDRLTIAISPGDHAVYGDGSATHHALLSLDGRELLGLRLIRGSGHAIRIIGVWRP